MTNNLNFIFIYFHVFIFFSKSQQNITFNLKICSEQTIILQYLSSYISIYGEKGITSESPRLVGGCDPIFDGYTVYMLGMTNEKL